MNHETLRALLETARTVKEGAFAAGEELVPVLACGHRDGRLTIVSLPIGREDLPSACRLIRHQHNGGHPYPSVAFIADVYYSQGHRDAERPAAGSLAERFRSGDMTVVEALVVTVVEPTGARLIHHPYRIADDGSIAWGEPDESEVAPGGLVSDALLEMVTP